MSAPAEPASVAAAGAAAAGAASAAAPSPAAAEPARPSVVSPRVQAFPARTPTLPPATHTNSYALGGREVLLVEPATPFDDERRAWLGWVAALRSQGRVPVALVLTHHHHDHVGGAAFLARETGLPVWAHARTAALLPELPVARHLAEGEVLTLAGPAPERWEVLFTPGHASGHVCLFSAETGELVVGDMVASEGTILIPPDDGDLGEYLRQLGRLAALGAGVALPAHGAPIAQPTHLFQHYVRHRLAREAKAVAALAAHPAGATLEALLPLVYDDTPRAVWPLARQSLAAHLLELERQGRARQLEEGRWASAG